MVKGDVLILCQFFYPEHVSSATLPFDTACAFSDAGLKVGALCGYPKEYSDKKHLPKSETVKGVKIKRVKYIQLGRKNFIGRLINYFSFTASVFFHLHELKKYKIVMVYSNPPILPLLASWSKKRYGTKFIFVAYDIYPEMPIVTHSIRENSVIHKVMNYVNAKVYKNADAVVALSREMKDFIVDHREIEARKVEIIPNWYADETGSFHAVTADNRYYEKYKNKFVVSYLGNMGICQDLDTILGAIRKLRQDSDIQFLFAGHGNKMQGLKDIVGQEHLENVVIYDFLQGKDYHDALEISDCAIVSLTKGLTGLCSPSKVYSYYMAGIPVVAIMGESDIGDDIEEYKIGYRINNGEAEKLVKCIRQLQGDTELEAKMKRNCVKLFKDKYTTTICTKKYVELIHRIIS